MLITEWLMHNYGNEQYTPGLCRIRAALDELLPSFKKTKIIIIAGTNGKGETTLRLSELLNQHTQCVWTSPHIERLTERMRDQAGEIGLSELQALIDKCHQVVLQKKLNLTFYEFLFFVFCSWAEAKKPEFLLLEVGLGGRLDAVNVFDADYVLLPSISRDHQEFLGNRYDLILEEKLGVLRPHSTLISFLDLKYLRERAQKKSLELGARYVDLEELSPVPSCDFSRRNQLLSYAAYLLLKDRGLHELKNAPVDRAGLEHRGEIFTRGADWHLFGSHNVDGMRKLIQFLRSGTYTFSRPPFDAVIVAFSRRDPGDLQVMLRMLKANGPGKVIMTTFDHPKAADKSLVESLCHQEGMEFADNVETYVQGKNEGQVLVTGSYYFLGHFKSLLRRRST